MAYRPKRFRRLSAVTSMLLATVAHDAMHAQLSAGSASLQVPRTAEECSRILDEVLGAVADSPGGADAVVDFLNDTNADHILRKYCEEKRYQEAFNYGKPFIDGFRDQAKKGPPPAPTSMCLEEAVIDPWKIQADAERYTLAKLVTINSRNEKLVRGGGNNFAVDGVLVDARRQIRLQLGLVDPFKPSAIDVEVKVEGAEPRRGRAPIIYSTWIDLSELMQDISENGATVEIAGSLDGAPLFDVSFPYTDTGPAAYEGLKKLNRLSKQRSAGLCNQRQCFLTTACCDLIGLEDDCFELRALRDFRDHVLGALPGGARDMAVYYAVAPILLAELRGAGRERALLPFYATHILPCAVLARAGLNAPTRWLYADLMRRLCRAYAPYLLAYLNRQEVGEPTRARR